MKKTNKLLVLVALLLTVLTVCLLVMGCAETAEPTVTPEPVQAAEELTETIAVPAPEASLEPAPELPEVTPELPGNEEEPGEPAPEEQLPEKMAEADEESNVTETAQEIISKAGGLLDKLYPEITGCTGFTRSGLVIDILLVALAIVVNFILPGRTPARLVGAVAAICTAVTCVICACSGQILTAHPYSLIASPYFVLFMAALAIACARKEQYSGLTVCIGKLTVVLASAVIYYLIGRMNISDGTAGITHAIDMKVLLTCAVILLLTLTVGNGAYSGAAIALGAWLAVSNIISFTTGIGNVLVSELNLKELIPAAGGLIAVLCGCLCARIGRKPKKAQ